MEENLVLHYYARTKTYVRAQFARFSETFKDAWTEIKRDILELINTKEQLISRESQIGRTLFGDIPVGHQRDFFNVNEHVWVWHESWRDRLGKKHEKVVKYDVHQSGVWKRVNEGEPIHLQGQELANFVAATSLYFQYVMPEIYSRDPVTGQLLS